MKLAVASAWLTEASPMAAATRRSSYVDTHQQCAAPDGGQDLGEVVIVHVELLKLLQSPNAVGQRVDGIVRARKYISRVRLLRDSGM
jgi:hypothetical protein